MPTHLFELLYRTIAAPSLIELALTLLAVGAFLVPLEWLMPAQPNVRQKRCTVLLNLAYWFFTPAFTKAMTSVIVAALILVFVLVQGRAIDSSLLDGFGPLSRQPLWLQTIEILLVADFIDYWSHRMFHTSRLWRFHAVHHSAEEMT